MSRLIVILLPVACLGYAVIALGLWQAWISGAAAMLLAGLLWRRHPRARFAAYVFFTVVAVRGVTRQGWLVLLFAVVAVLVLQTAAAREAWPRLTPGFRREGDGRMRGP